MLTNLKLKKAELSTWRRIALGTWSPAGDPSVYGVLDINASKIEARRQAISASGRKPPTYTVIIAKATALTFKRYPQINAILRCGRIYLRESVQLFLQAAVDDEGKELSGVVIQDADQKSIAEITEKLQKTAAAIRANKDPTFKKTKSIFSLIPFFLMRRFLNLLSTLLYTFNISPKLLGMPHDPFGSVMITSIGSIGLDQGFAPIVPYSRTPMLLAVGRVQDRPVAVNGKLDIHPMLTVCVTFDHRVIDGVYSAKLAKAFRIYLETEEGLDELGLRV